MSLEDIKDPYKKIVFKEDEGFYGGDHNVPYNIYYDIVCKDEDITGGFFICAENPAYFVLTNDTEGGYSLSIYIHKSVPREFVDILFFHEIKEAEFKFSKEIEPSVCHKMAVEEEGKYLERNFNNEQIIRFKEYEATIRKI